MGEELVEAVRRALRAVRDPASGQDVVASGMVQGLAARDGMVQFALAVPRERAREMEPLREAAERAAAAVPGVLSATVVLTAHREPQGLGPPLFNAIACAGLRCLSFGIGRFVPPAPAPAGRGLDAGQCPAI